MLIPPPSLCPVLCSGHGDYGGGSCHCHEGWKGEECDVRLDECQVRATRNQSFQSPLPLHLLSSGAGLQRVGGLCGRGVRVPHRVDWTGLRSQGLPGRAHGLFSLYLLCV